MTTEAIEQPTTAQPSTNQVERVNAILDVLSFAKVKSQQLTARDIARRSHMGIEQVRLIIPDMLRRDWIIERMRPEKRLEIYELSELGELVASGAHTCPDCGIRCESEQRLTRHEIKCHGAGAVYDAEKDRRMQATVIENLQEELAEDMPAERLSLTKPLLVEEIWPKSPDEESRTRRTTLAHTCCPRFQRLWGSLEDNYSVKEINEKYQLKGYMGNMLDGIEYCPFCGSKIGFAISNYVLMPITSKVVA